MTMTGRSGHGAAGDRTIAVVSGGLSQPSSTRLLADRLAAATTAALGRSGLSTHIVPIDLRTLARPLADAMVTGFPSQDLQSALDAVASADGLIAVTPIFSGSYSGLFKSFFDVTDPEALSGLPVLIGATGGTARHSLALDHAVRPLFIYFRSVVIPTGVFAATEDFGSSGSSAGLNRRIARASAEFAGLVAAAAQHGAADPFEDPPTFAELLAAGGQDD
jgi:FMN reductase